MPTIVKTYSALVAEINKRVTKAVELTAKEMEEKLKECIQEDYYDMFSPEWYVRTEKFLNSAVSKMLGNSSASIGIDEAYFGYEYPARYKLRDGSAGHWTGEDQVMMAQHGYHGTYFIHTNGDYWSSFIEWADNNAVNLLKSNIKKCGVPVK